MVRDFSFKRYFAAFFITALIFSVGLLIGLLVEGKRLGYIQDKDLEQRINYNSLQVQQLYISLLAGKENCQALQSTFDYGIDTLVKAQRRLEDYNKDSLINKGEYDLLRRDYFISEMRYWLLAEEIKRSCGYDVVTVLNFYKPDCDDCDSQGFVLDYLKKKFKDKLLVFSFDGTNEEAIIEILKDAYNVSEYPTLVIDDDVIEGLSDKEDLIDVICESFEDWPEECG